MRGRCVIDSVQEPIVPLPLYLDGASSPTLISDATGCKWVRKVRDGGLRHQFLGEVLAGLLGIELEVPIPEFRVNMEPLAFYSRYIEYSMTWADFWSTSVNNEPDFGRILALDVLMLNSDRVEENILLEQAGDGELQVWAIDNGGNVAWDPAEFLRRRDDIPDAQVLPRSVPVGRLEAHVLNCAADAQALSQLTLNEIASAACRYSGMDVSHELVDVLVHRCRRADQLVRDYMAALANR